MRIYMALQTVRESFVHCCSIRFTMAMLTPWDLAVADVTGCALQISVFGVVGLQVVINLGMT